MMEETIDAIPAIRGRTGRPRRRPLKAHLDKGYDYGRCRQALRKRHIIPRIARRGIESKKKLGRHRWVVERTISWLHAFRRLRIRYERLAMVHAALLAIGCFVICSRFT